MAEEQITFIKSNFEFGVNLENAALYQLDFLETVNKIHGLRQDDVIERALWRYEYCWLPLVDKNAQFAETLVAPLDIEWIWHCHLLSPLAYEKDCLNITGSLIDHTLFASGDKEINTRKSRQLWETEYTEEPFNLIDQLGQEDTSCLGKLPPKDSQISYDIRAALARQKDFFYEVSLPHFRDKDFLAKALERYQKFLFLRQHFPSFFLVPTYDIDLMWHTHQLHPVVYHRDTKKLLGGVFNHDDSVNDRSPGSKLSQADTETSYLWKNTFEEPFSTCGAMYRGDPPNGTLATVSYDTLLSMSTKVCIITLQHIGIQGLQNPDNNLSLKLHLEINDYGQRKGCFDSDRQALGRLRDSGGHWSGHNMCRFEYETLYHQGIQFSLSETVVVLCCLSTVDHRDGTHDLLTTIENSYPEGGMVEKVVAMDSSDKVKLRFKAKLGQSAPGPIFLTVVPGVYETCVMPESSEEMWGPIPLTRLPPDSVNHCDVASHRLVDHRGKLQFTCRTIHCLPLTMSAIHVFYKDKMVVVGHLIGTDQLPLRSQLMSDDCPSIKPGCGERALLIKNNAGDWGVMLGRWRGFIQVYKHSRVTNPGYLEARLYKIATKHWETIKTDNKSGRYDVKINNMTVDLNSGIIKAEAQDLAENLAVAFGLGLLHVLCQPRPSIWTPGINLPVGSKPSKEMVLIQAAGHNRSAPTNRYLYTTHRRRADDDDDDEDVFNDYNDDKQAGCVGMGGSWVGKFDTDTSPADWVDCAKLYGDGDWGSGGDTDAEGSGGLSRCGACVSGGGRGGDGCGGRGGGGGSACGGDDNSCGGGGGGYSGGFSSSGGGGGGGGGHSSCGGGGGGGGGHHSSCGGGGGHSGGGGGGGGGHHSSCGGGGGGGGHSSCGGGGGGGGHSSCGGGGGDD